MNKPISKDIHGWIDYSYAMVVPLLPEITKFDDPKSIKLIFRTLGASVLGYTLFTKARWGVIRLLPFKAHLAVDISVRCIAIITPWLFGFSRATTPRNAIIAAGVLGLVTGLLTETKEEAVPEQDYLFI